MISFPLSKNQWLILVALVLCTIMFITSLVLFFVPKHETTREIVPTYTVPPNKQTKASGVPTTTTPIAKTITSTVSTNFDRPDKDDGCDSISYCDSSWTYLELTDSCYKKLHNETWHDAQKICEKMSSNLASIHSKTENFFVNNMCYNRLDGYGIGVEEVNCWIGLYKDEANNNMLKYSDGSSFDFSYWHHGEPSNYEEQCVMTYSGFRIKRAESVFLVWNDVVCDDHMRSFICKKAANKLLFKK